MIRKVSATNKLIILLAILCPVAASYSQTVTVWPGDVNNNGVVNGLDFLYWSWAEGDDNAMGPPRAVQTIDWAAQSGTEWGISFPTGLDLAYADCDGDGEVNDDDKEAIDQNLGLTHGTLTADDFSSGLPGQDPGLVLQPLQSSIAPQETLEVDITLGMGQVVNDIFGVSFDVFYDPDLIDDPGNAITLELVQGSWFGDEPNEVHQFITKDEGAGRLTVGLARKGQATASGEGPIARLIIVMEDIVAISADSVKFEVDSLAVFDGTVKAIPAYGQGASVELVDSLATSVTSAQQILDITLSPNPVIGTMALSTSRSMDTAQLRVIDMHGRQLWEQEWQGGDRMQIELGTLPAGIYLLEIASPEGSAVKKFCKQ